jgi:hypothetical protein
LKDLNELEEAKRIAQFALNEVGENSWRRKQNLESLLKNDKI